MRSLQSVGFKGQGCACPHKGVSIPEQPIGLESDLRSYTLRYNSKATIALEHSVPMNPGSMAYEKRSETVTAKRDSDDIWSRPGDATEPKEGEDSCARFDLFSWCRNGFRQVCKSVWRSAPVVVLRYQYKLTKEKIKNLFEDAPDVALPLLASSKKTVVGGRLCRDAILLEEAGRIPKLVSVGMVDLKRQVPLRRFRGNSKRRELEDDSALPDLQDDTPESRYPKREEHAEQFDKEGMQKLSYARRDILTMDAHNGPIQNNPKVTAILMGLGTPYDALDFAKSLVYALQLEEIAEEQQRRQNQAGRSCSAQHTPSK